MYVQDYEIMPLLNRVNGDIDYELFDDKLKFFFRCNELGIRTIPTIAKFENGTAEFLDNNPLPESDLFKKPQSGKCGQGASLIVFEGIAGYRLNNKWFQGKKRLLETLCNDSWKQPLILQQRIRNHPAIDSLSQGALCTCRIITCIDLSGNVHIIASIFKMPVGGKSTDNFATGGIAIPVDSMTGILGKGITKERAADRIAAHPDTGVKFTGFKIPYWDQVIELCHRVHFAFSMYPFIGWDIAVDVKGPLIVEGNLQFGVDAVQMAHDSPLGRSVFGRQYLAHLKKRRAADKMGKSAANTQLYKGVI